jgi:hypothetical protein
MLSELRLNNWRIMIRLLGRLIKKDALQFDVAVVKNKLLSHKVLQGKAIY